METIKAIALAHPFWAGVYVTGALFYFGFQIFFWTLGGGKDEQFAEVILSPFVWFIFVGKAVFKFLKIFIR